MIKTAYDEMIDIVEEAKVGNSMDSLLKKLGLVSLITSGACMTDDDEKYSEAMRLAQDMVFSDKNEAYAPYAWHIIGACNDSWDVRNKKYE